VLVDDLVGRGTSEPYRMLSARAEFRLSLRADNADARLSGLGLELGLVGAGRAAAGAARLRLVAEAEAAMAAVRLPSAAWARRGLPVGREHKVLSLADVLTRKGVTLEAAAGAAAAEGAAGSGAVLALLAQGGGSGGCAAVATAVSNCRYAPYVARQAGDVAALRRDEALLLPPGLDYGAMASLSAEDREKLEAARPPSIAHAQRLPGVTPAAVLRLYRHVVRGGGGGGGSSRGAEAVGPAVPQAAGGLG
jgi:tRNA uridine 5-carboxymethylaminomethyl modification enzyme